MHDPAPRTPMAGYHTYDPHEDVRDRPIPARRRHRRRRRHAHRQRPSDLAQPRRRDERRRTHHQLRREPVRGAHRGRVKGFDPATAMDRKMARRMSRFIQLGMAAGTEAVRDSGLDFADWSPERRDRVAVAVNTSGGGQEQVIDGTAVLHDKGPRFVSPFAIPALSGSMAACQLSMEYGLTGPVITQVAACASSVIAFLDGLRMIQRGDVDVVLVGGSEAPLLPVAFAALANMGALSRRNDDPTRASRPFDAGRDGFLFGEGAGVVILESAEHALARDATIHCEVLGAALTADAFHISAPEPTGRGAARAMTEALRDAGVAPDGWTTSWPTAPRRRSTT
ncbi:MAG: beta-ketoacyl synthase N-terminal-like domain-containing protein [Chloroflexota bacterium]